MKKLLLALALAFFFPALVSAAGLTAVQGGTGTSTWLTNSIPFFSGFRFTENTGLTFDGTKFTATYASTTALTVSGSINLFGTDSSNTTGTGNIVLATSPTIATPSIATLRGGTAATSNITIQGTSSASPTTGGTIRLAPSGAAETARFTNLGFGIGTTTPRWPLQIGSSTISQLTLSDNATVSNHWSFRSAGGYLYIATSSPTTFATSTVSALTIDPNGKLTVNSLSVGDGIISTGTSTATYFAASTLGFAGAPAFTFSSDVDTGTWSPSANQLAFSTAGSEAMRLTAQQRMLLGTTAARAIGGQTNNFELEGTGATGMSVTRNSADTTSAAFTFGKSRDAAVGGVTAVTTSDVLGTLNFAGADGTDLVTVGADIRAVVRSAVSAGIVPTSLDFRTSNTAGSLTQRMRIDSEGNFGFGNVTPLVFMDVAPNTVSGTPANAGANFRFRANTFTDNNTAISGTAATYNSVSFAQSTLAATNASVTTTNAPNLDVNGAIIAGANETITNSYGLRVQSLASVAGAGTVTNGYGLAAAAPTGATNNFSAIFTGGNVGIGTTSPATLLHISGNNTGAIANNTLRFEDQDTTTQANQQMGKLEFYSADASAPGAGVKAYILAAAEGVAPSSYLSFATDAVTGTPIEAYRVDSSQRILQGNTATRSVGSFASQFQQESTGATTGISLVRNSADASGTVLTFGKSRGAAVGGTTAVNSGDTIAQLVWAGADGTNLTSRASAIQTLVDGTVSTGIVPGRLSFHTANTSGTLTEVMRIDSAQHVIIGAGTTPSAVLDILANNYSDTPSGGGQQFRARATVFTDSGTAGSATVAAVHSASFGQFTLAATNAAVNTTLSAGLALGGPTVASTNELISTSVGLNIAPGGSCTGAGVCYSAAGIRVVQPTGASGVNAAGVFVNTVATANSSQLRLVSDSQGITAGELLGGIDFATDDTNLAQNIMGSTTASIAALANEGHTLATLGTDLVFRTTATGNTATNTEKMRLTGAGFLGLGTTTPESMAQLTDGNLEITNSAGGDFGVIFADILSTRADTDYWAGLVTDNGGNDDDVFQIGKGTAIGTTPYMTLNTTGRLGIGTTTPVSQLTVASSTGPQLALTDASLTSNPWTFRAAGGFFYLSTSSPLTFATSTMPAMTINSSGFLGIGSSTPNFRLSVDGFAGETMGIATTSVALPNQMNKLMHHFVATTTVNGTKTFNWVQEAGGPTFAFPPIATVQVYFDSDANTQLTCNAQATPTTSTVGLECVLTTGDGVTETTAQDAVNRIVTVTLDGVI